jgi:hypothetical protein
MFGGVEGVHESPMDGKTYVVNVLRKEPEMVSVDCSERASERFNPNDELCVQW